jgi:hypothetical protein
MQLNGEGSHFFTSSRLSVLVPIAPILHTKAPVSIDQFSEQFRLTDARLETGKLRNTPAFASLLLAICKLFFDN